ncbi:MAG: patatin-like phospholipase family protein [Hyphomicrobiaceae bacterium]
MNEAGRHRHRLSAVEAFRELSDHEIEELGSRLETLTVPRGVDLVKEGEAADALFIVVSGRFEVVVSGRRTPVAKIGAGSPIGEIAFFAGGRRTATVVAIRDSLVLKLDRHEFERLCERLPALWRSVMATLGERLAATTAGVRPAGDGRPKTIAVVQAGIRPIPSIFIETFREIFSRHGKTLFLDHASTSRRMPAGMSLGSPETTRALNELESRYDQIVFLADGEVTPWSEKAVRQADLVLLVGVHAPNGPVDRSLSAIERFVVSLHRPEGTRLVLLHDAHGPIQGTAAWLDKRTVHMHHHVALDRRADYERLYRFVTGQALGFVACGGGALCSAHIGVYKALLEAGVHFDIFGGTSGGAAMTAAFALGATPEEIEERTHYIFVENKALRRYNWPRYSLVDHKVFDDLLAAHYTDTTVEDLWLPYFSISTNLSSFAIHCHRRGRLWHAVRASGSIPALLPPFYTPEGEMLVDGSLLDNVPVQMMHELKLGPNLVVAFEVSRQQLFDVDYGTLPSRFDLLWRMMNPMARDRLPDAPSVATVLMRSLMANRHSFERHLRETDALLVPPIPSTMGVMDWHLHSRIVELGYAYARSELQRFRAEGCSWLQEPTVEAS